MSEKNSYQNFENLTFEDFRKLAQDPMLSRHEKVGFPDSYREEKEDLIFDDMLNKVSNISLKKMRMLEIGPGCSALPLKLSEICKYNDGSLIFVDSQEMLAHLPEGTHIKKYVGQFPSALGKDLQNLSGRIDVIIAYSVIQYVFAEGGLHGFIDRCLSLLDEGGEFFIGDIPNVTMRKRFFSSDAGEASHREFTGSDGKPVVNFNNLEIDLIDDSVVLSILSRARAQGFHAWVLPQANGLPMANRREDILIRKP